MTVPTDTTGKHNYSNLKERLYFSFWSWNLLKDCPQSFYLRIILRKEPPKGESKHNAIQGGVPDKQAEDFFKIPVNQRDMNFFLDTFEQYWNQFLQEQPVDWVMYALAHAKKKNIKLASTDPDFLRTFGHNLRKEETREHCTNLMSLISGLRLHEKVVHTQFPFNVTIEPKKESPGMLQPELAFGGRPDLVVELGNNHVEIWDVKAVQSPKQLDQDQLLIYKMGLQMLGKVVDRVGYLHAKQKEVDVKRLTVIDEDALKKSMRQSAYYINSNQWPANYRKWKCSYCDVRQDCHAYQAKQEHDSVLAGLKSGRVDF